MMFDPLILELAEILPLDRAEQDDIARVIQLVLSSTPLHRGAQPDWPDPHLVSYFPLLDPQAQAILLGAHRKSGLWLPPGGHVEAGEHPRVTAQRECREELREKAWFLHPAPVFLTISRTVGPRPHEDICFWYALRGAVTDLPDFDRGEYDGMRWFGLAEVPFDKTDPNLRRFLSKVFDGNAALSGLRNDPETALPARP